MDASTPPFTAPHSALRLVVVAGIAAVASGGAP
jgi:hypothetical protein